MKVAAMELSIVIPAYNECDKIVSDIEAAGEFLKSSGLCGEIIVVDDGSSDGTVETARVAKCEGVEVRVIEYGANRGKGYAVRKGMEQSQGEYVMFADSGCCVPYSFAADGLEMIKQGKCEIAHGSRKTAGCEIRRGQLWHRRIFSWLFRRFVVFWMGVPGQLSDTQCGFKIYRGDVGRELYGECVTDGFMFDIEIILRAISKGYRIREFAIAWTCDRDSRLSASRNSFEILRELILIKKELKKVKH